MPETGIDIASPAHYILVNLNMKGMSMDCWYAFKIIETRVRKEGEPSRIQKTITDVMKVPVGVKDHVVRTPDGSVEVLRTFPEQTSAELAHHAEAYANEIEKAYGCGERAKAQLRKLLDELEHFGLSHSAVGRLVGNRRAIHHALEDRYKTMPSLPRLLARVKYLNELCKEVAMCSTNCLSWSPHGKGCRSAGWFRDPRFLDVDNHTRFIITAGRLGSE